MADKPLIEYGEERRKHFPLRDMVKHACEGVLPHIAERIKDVARRAYYLGAKDGIEVERAKTDTRALAEKTIANHREIVDAVTRIRLAEKSGDKRTEIEKQEDYVAANLDRCRRCGDGVHPILPTQPLSLLCGDCERSLKATEGGVMWFAELVAAVEKKT